MKVKKRNGQIVDFNKDKITTAIQKAMTECGRSSCKTDAIIVCQNVIDKLVDHIIPVEDIQNLVETALMEEGYFDVAKAYMLYRYKHQLIRDSKSKLMEQVAEKLQAKAVENQNANVDENSFGGRIGEAARLVMKEFALENCMSEMSRNNHINNEIYIHDLDSYAVGMHNCLSVPFDDLLANGFNTRQTDVRPAQSINTAFQLIAVIFQLQSLQQFGGVASTHLDWTMVPYVRKSFYKHFLIGMGHIDDEMVDPDYEKNTGEEFCFDDRFSIEHPCYKQLPNVYKYALERTEKELNQAVEGMYHNLNTLQSRSGNQLPFTSINYGTCTLPEGRMVIKALLKGSINGVGELHKTPIFPCGIFQMMKEVNRVEGDPNYDLFQLALESTSKRLYPNYANCDWSGNAGYDKNDPRTYFSTMGKCKLQLI